MSLAKLNDKRAVGPLINASKSDKDADVRKAAADALEKIKK